MTEPWERTIVASGDNAELSLRFLRDEKIVEPSGLGYAIREGHLLVVGDHEVEQALANALNTHERLVNEHGVEGWQLRKIVA